MMYAIVSKEWGEVKGTTVFTSEELAEYYREKIMFKYNDMYEVRELKVIESKEQAELIDEL